MYHKQVAFYKIRIVQPGSYRCQDSGWAISAKRYLFNIAYLDGNFRGLFR